MPQRPYPVLNPRPGPCRGRLRWLAVVALVAAGAMLAGEGSHPGGAGAAAARPAPVAAQGPGGRRFVCNRLAVTDGDTLRCGQLRVRLYGIDAPELPGHCRPGRACTPGDPHASRDHLRRLAGQGQVICQAIETDSYGRIVARCRSGAGDLSCGQIARGHAVARYGALRC